MKLEKGKDYNVTLQIHVNEDVEDSVIDTEISDSLYLNTPVIVVDISEYEEVQLDFKKLNVL